MLFVTGFKGEFSRWHLLQSESSSTLGGPGLLEYFDCGYDLLCVMGYQYLNNLNRFLQRFLLLRLRLMIDKEDQVSSCYK